MLQPLVRRLLRRGMLHVEHRLGIRVHAPVLQPVDGVLELRVLAGQHGAPILQAAAGRACLALLGPRERRRARILSDQKTGRRRLLLRRLLRLLSLLWGLLLRGRRGLLGRLH